jgi:type I restriction enzyme, S subunit
MEVKPGYKETEVGVLPEEWAFLPFNDLGSVIDGDRGVNYPSTRDFSDNGYCLFLNAGNVTKNGFRFEECMFITREKDQKLSKGKLKRQDIVLTTRGTVGNFAYFDASVPFHNLRINSGMVILRSESSAITPPFLYALLQSHSVRMQIERLSFGSAQPQLTVKGINKLGIILPPTPEQDAIAQTLADVNGLLGGLELLIAKQHDLKQAVMQQLLTGQTRVKGFGPTKAFKRFDYGFIPDDWSVRPFGKVSTMSGRIGWQGLKQDEFTENPDDPFLITGMNFKDGRIRWEEVYHIPMKRYQEAAAIQLKTGDVLITKDGTIGKLLFVDAIPYPGMASLNSHLLVFRPIERQYDPKFLFYQLGSPTFARHVELHKSGSTFFGLTQAATAKYPVVLPSLSEQTAIVEVLTEMDVELAALEQRREKTHALKQAMMQQLLTGKIRLI